MFLPLLLLAGVGGLAVYFGTAATRKQPPAAVSASMADKMAKYTLAGPKGERVFRPEIAEAIVRTLASQLYHYLGTGTDPSVVQVSADPSGVPPGPDMSALGWARLQNKSLSILAPVYLAEASSADRYLRAVAPGSENWDSGQLYAVLAYAGALAKAVAPGLPPTPGATPPATLLPTPVQSAHADIPADLQPLYTELLTSGTDPNQMLFVASELDAVGCSAAADLLRKRAADIRALPPVALSPAASPTTALAAASAAAAAAQRAVAAPAPTPTPLTALDPAQPFSSAQKNALQMNVALAKFGYRQVDQPAYKAFQASVGTSPDGFPGAGTMAKLKGALSTIPGVVMAPVPVYPWHTKPGTSGYDGVNAPPLAQWLSGSKAAAAPPVAALPSASPAPSPAPVAVPTGNGAFAPVNWSTAAPSAIAIEMNNRLSAHGYNVADQAVYKAFQASQGLGADGYPGPSTMGKLRSVLSSLGATLANVTIFPWHSKPGTSGYDGVNAPAWSDWTAPVGSVSA